MISGALKTLEAQNIPVGCLTAAISHVGDLIRNSKDGEQVAAAKLINSLLGADIASSDHMKFIDDNNARHLALHVVKHIFEKQDNFDPIELLDKAASDVKVTRSKPELKWLWTPVPIKDTTTEGGQYVDEGESVKQVGDTNTKVVIKTDGTLKKGGRKPASEALYRKHVLEAEKPLSSREFTDLLMKELKMSEAGARTYNHNCKKALGVPQNADGTVKQGVKVRHGKKGEGPSRQSRANDLYTKHVVNGEKLEKAAFMVLLQKELDTTRLGAQTMYYAAKKLHETGVLNSSAVTAEVPPTEAVTTENPFTASGTPAKKAKAKKKASTK